MTIEKNTHIISLLCLFHYFTCQPKGKTFPPPLKCRPWTWGQRWMKNDFATFVKYMHPNIIAYAGGKEKMQTKMDSVYSAMKLLV